MAKSWPKISKSQLSRKSSSGETYYLRRFFPWGMSIKHCKHKRAKRDDGDCDSAKAAAPVAATNVQSLCQKVSSRDEGLGLYGLDLSSAATDLWWLEEEQEEEKQSRSGGLTPAQTTWHRPGDSGYRNWRS